jgi:hypothetical protein
LIEWQIFWALEPPLADRLELAIGILCSLTANINRDSKRRPQPFEAKDFMIHWEERLKEPQPEQQAQSMSPEEILAAFDQLIADQETTGRIVTRQ